ncbi:hypothetical protein MES4922_290117 [Mesorhizobium ventifaucium]|uniref:Uncharacterized protein n=1 Tax=Mesorhizobium ventifaucium TaxID=666020 RepID=A0ABM9DWS2_9HYPH|nr:hypothetical protein MES4922_290117 [Mesorhizobium ventifaucium]
MFVEAMAEPAADPLLIYGKIPWRGHAGQIRVVAWPVG